MPRKKEMTDLSMDEILKMIRAAHAQTFRELNTRGSEQQLETDVQYGSRVPRLPIPFMEIPQREEMDPNAVPVGQWRYPYGSIRFYNPFISGNEVQIRAQNNRYVSPLLQRMT